MKKYLTTLGLLLASALSVFATTPTLESITQPLYFLGSASDNIGEPKYIKVPRILNHTYPPLMAHVYASPTFAPNHSDDLNLASVYGLKVSAKEIRATSNSQKNLDRIEFTIDLKKASQPTGYDIPISKVGEYTAKAIRIDFSDSEKFPIVIISSQKTVIK